MRKSYVLSASLFALGILAAAPAAAEDEIVVTATRAPAAVETLPAEVDVIDADAARRRGAFTLADALREAPGLNVVISGGAGQQTSLFAGGANSNHTLVLFDGLRINDPSTPGSSFDAGQDLFGELDRIEVVQGPMSAVFGSDALGGVVNLIPRRGAEGPINARLDIGGGDFGTLTAAAGADGALGAFRYAVTAEGYATDGFDLVPERMSTHTGEADGADMTTLTGVFDLALSDAFALDLLVRQRQSSADFDPFLFDFSTFQEYRAEDDNLEISKNDLSLARIGADWTISEDVTLRATYGGMHQERVQSDDGADTDIFEGERRFADLTLTWRRGEDFALVAGLVSEEEDVDIAQGFGFPPPSVFTSASADHSGAFVTLQDTLGALTLTGAVRLDDYEGFGAETTWRAGASWAAAPFARIYAAYGTSFRAPTLYERFVSFGDPNLDPESATTWEIGADAHFEAFGQERGVEFGAVYRSSEIEDLIDFGSSFTYANVDEASVETAQARVAVQPLSWLTARSTYVHTEARDEIADAPLLRRPEAYWTTDVTVEHGPFAATLGWRQVGARADQLYGDDAFSLGVGEAPSYDVARLSASYEVRQGIELYASADNLTDEDYEPVNAFAGAPRTVIAGVRLRNGQ